MIPEFRELPPDPPRRVPPPSSPHRATPLNMGSATTNPIKSYASVINNQNSNPDPNPNTSTSQARPSSATSSQLTTSSCAACNYQGRHCAPDCAMAPYFRADQQRQFLNAHRLFGVSNILKIIQGLDQQNRDEAMKSIIFESNARAADPIGGCYGIVCELERMLHNYAVELVLVNSHLERARAHSASAAASMVHSSQHHYPNLIHIEKPNDNVHETNLLNLVHQHDSSSAFVMNDFNMNVNHNDSNSAFGREMLSLYEKRQGEDVKQFVDISLAGMRRLCPKVRIFFLFCVLCYIFFSINSKLSMSTSI